MANKALFWSFFVSFCAFLWLKNPFNQRNQRLINYLHAFGIFTTVERALQIRLFMQNKPNLPKAQRNVSTIITKDYENKTLGEHGKNEPKTNPNEPNLLNAKMNVNKVLTKNYEKKSNWTLGENEPKTTPIKANSKPIKAKQTQPVVSLPALSTVAGVEPISEAKKCCCV